MKTQPKDFKVIGLRDASPQEILELKAKYKSEGWHVVHQKSFEYNGEPKKLPHNGVLRCTKG